ncbi:hypothetical protein MY4824_008658 [Beauveria thailandica]
MQHSLQRVVRRRYSSKSSSPLMKTSSQPSR